MSQREREAGSTFHPQAAGDTLTVSLEGGVPLADVTFLGPLLGLNIFPEDPLLGSVTLPISALSTNLTAEQFTQFANIALKPNSFYWIGLDVSPGPNEEEVSPIGWGDRRQLGSRRLAGLQQQRPYGLHVLPQQQRW